MDKQKLARVIMTNSDSRSLHITVAIDVYAKVAKRDGICKGNEREKKRSPSGDLVLGAGVEPARPLLVIGGTEGSRTLNPTRGNAF